jgi:hypothetical protein
MDALDADDLGTIEREAGDLLRALAYQPPQDDRHSNPRRASVRISL